MTASKPEVQGWRVTRLSGNGYGRERTIVDSEIYNAEDPAFWLPGAMERHSIEPLIRLTDHETARTADKARIAELTEALKNAREMVADWGAYASEYFREKHGLDRDIAELDAALAQQGKENES